MSARRGTIVEGVYLMLALVVWAMFTGSIYRGWWPFGLVAGLEDPAWNPGEGKADAAIGVALYLIYYSSLFYLPYFVIREVLLHNAPKSLERDAVTLSAVAAGWCALTFVLYHEAMFSVVRVMLRSTASEWLGVLWVVGFIVVVLMSSRFVRDVGNAKAAL